MRKCYISRNKFLYTVKRKPVPKQSPVWKLCIWFVRSREWYALPGMPDYATLEEAEARLDELARDNRWQLIDSVHGIRKAQGVV